MQLELEPNSSSLFVIDGQHRLWGASKCEQEIYLPVCIFTNLELKQEVQYFLDINSNQKGVPKTLRIELLKFLSEPDSLNKGNGIVYCLSIARDAACLCWLCL